MPEQSELMLELYSWLTVLVGDMWRLVEVRRFYDLAFLWCLFKNAWEAFEEILKDACLEGKLLSLFALCVERSQQSRHLEYTTAPILRAPISRVRKVLAQLRLMHQICSW